MSEQEELRIRRAINAASQSGDAAAELAARRELQALLGSQQAGRADTQQPEQEQAAQEQGMSWTDAATQAAQLVGRAQGQINPMMNPEVLLSTLSSFAAEPISGYVGALGAALPGEEGQGERWRQATSEALTYEPKTAYGQAGQQAFAEDMAPVASAFEFGGEVSGTAGEEIGRIFGIEPGSEGARALYTLGRVMPAAVAELIGLKMSRTVPTIGREVGDPGPRLPQMPGRQRAAQSLSRGEYGRDTAPFELQESYSGRPRVERVPEYSEVIRQGFDDTILGDIKLATPEQLRAMNNMVEIRRSQRNLGQSRESRRATNIVGDAVAERVEFVTNMNRNAGAAVDDAAKSLRGVEINTAGIVDQFRRSITEKLGVSFDDAGRPVYGPESVIDEGTASAKLLEGALDRARGVERASNNAYVAHQVKRNLDNKIREGTLSEGGVNGDVQRLVLGLRRTIDDILDGNSPEYDKANTEYSQTLTALDRMQEALGPSIDISTEGAAVGIGGKMRSLFSNNAKRMQIEQSLDAIDETARQFGGEFDTDVRGLAHFANALESVLGTEASTGLAGQVRTASPPIPGEGRILLRAAEGAIEKVRGVNPDTQIDAIQKAISESLRRRSAAQ